MAERVEQRVGPRTRRLGALEVPLGGGGLGPCLLAEHVVGDLPSPVGVHAGGGGRGEVAERIARQFADARGGHAEHSRQLVVGLSAPDDELEDRPLLGRKLVESGHKQGEG